MSEKSNSSLLGQPHRISTARSIAWNYVGHFYQIAINLGLTAYIVRRIAVAEYGLLMLTMSLSASLYFLDLGLSSVLVQSYVAASLSNDKNRLSELISTAFAALAALGSIGVLLFVILAALLPGPFKIPQAYLNEASIVLILSSLIIQVRLPSIALEQVYQSVHRFDRINQIQLVTSTVYAALSVLALATGHRIIALVCAQLIAAVLQCVLLCIGLHTAAPRAHMRLSFFRWMHLRGLLDIGKWAFLNDLSTYAFDLLVWVILGSFGSMSEAALYGLASKLPKQLWNLMDRGAGVALPLLSRSFAESDSTALQRTFVKTQKLLFGLILPFALLGCFAARPLIQVWAGSSYSGSALILQFLLIGALSHASGYSSGQLLYACRQVKKAAIILSCEYVIAIAIAPFLVSRYGAAGLAAGIAATQILINWGWYAFAAGRIVQISFLQILRAVLQGLAWPALVLAAEIAILWALRFRLSSIEALIAAIVAGCVYLGIWSIETALPIYRAEIPA
jgi:O-antigen/teichoic acid export membrane protein